MRIPVTGRTKLEVAKRGMELEKRGWECVTPIHAVSTTYFKQLDNGAFTDKFSHNKEKYRAIYEKVRNV